MKIKYAANIAKIHFERQLVIEKYFFRNLAKAMFRNVVVMRRTFLQPSAENINRAKSDKLKPTGKIRRNAHQACNKQMV